MATDSLLQTARARQPKRDDAPGAAARVAGPNQAGLAALSATLNARPQVQHLAAMMRPPVQRAANRTGLPDTLKAGVEALSGLSMDGVQVHRNSSRPAQLNAHAYAQGRDIHLAPGQERHLPHEAWHVVQQAQGRVRPTVQLKSGVPVNDDSGLEHEADVMGRRSMRTAGHAQPAMAQTVRSASAAVQRVGGQKYGLKAELNPDNNAVQAEGLAALKAVQTAYKIETKAIKTAAVAAFTGHEDEKPAQAIYTNELRRAEMTPEGLIAKWTASGAGRTVDGTSFLYHGVKIATIPAENDAYYQVEAPAAPGLSAVYKRHRLDDDDNDEYVDVGGVKLRRHAKRGITPPDRAAYKRGQDLQPINFGVRAGKKPVKFDDAGKKKAPGKAKDVDVNWLNEKANATLAETPADPGVLAFLQAAKGTGKAFSATSTPGQISSNQGESFSRFGDVSIDLAHVPTANIIHHYKAAPFNAATLKAAVGGDDPAPEALGTVTKRANDSIIRNREIILTQIPRGAITGLRESQSRTEYEAQFRLEYTRLYKEGYRQAMIAAGLADAAPAPATLPWNESHFTAAQADKDVAAKKPEREGMKDAAPRAMFARDYRRGYTAGWIASYNRAIGRASVEHLQPPNPNVPQGTEDGRAQGTADGNRDGAAAGDEQRAATDLAPRVDDVRRGGGRQGSRARGGQAQPSRGRGVVRGRGGATKRGAKSNSGDT